jgi:two-component system, LytTR family, response regulator
MKPLRVAIVDDEPPARRKVRRMVEAANDTEVVGEAGSGSEAIELVNRCRPNLLFLDIQLPDMDGFGVIDALGPRPGLQVVFVTAFDHHAVKAFEVRALDYLLKPVAPTRFIQMLDRVRERLSKRGAPITLDTGSGVSLVYSADISLAESARNYVIVHARGESFHIRSTLDAFAEQLDPETFVRINRSQLLNLTHVRELRPITHGDYRAFLRDGTELNWSRRYTPRSHLARFGSH